MNNKIILSLTFFTTALLSNRLAAQQSSEKYYSDPRSTSSQGATRKTPARIKTDSTIKLVYKEVVQELPAEKNAVIKIMNTTCNLDIRPWPEAKMKMVTTIGIDEKKADKITTEELLSQAGIIFKSFGNRVDLQTRTSFSGEPAGRLYRTIGASTSATSVFHSVDVTESAFPQSGQQSVRWLTTGSTLRSMTLYVPEGCRLDIDNKNTGIVINADIQDARFKLVRSSLDARNFKKLFVEGEYYAINISNVDEAELELQNGNFTGGIIRSLDLDSKGSEIDYESGDELYLRSQSDRISVDEVAKVGGRKLYGDLRIGKLTSGIDLEGTNADIRIRNISPLAENIKVNNQYANLRLPVKSVTNFEVMFSGTNSTVFAPFEKVIIPDTLSIKTVAAPNDKTIKRVKVDGKDVNIEELDSPNSSNAKTLIQALDKTGNKIFEGLSSSRAPSRFKASGGEITGKHTKFEITCSNCSVDFK